MPHRKTKVYGYLIFLQKYFLGDLSKFEILCANAESEEQLISNNANPSNGPYITITLNPDSFEFIHGNPVISRCTIPITTTLFAIIDILGFLVGGKTSAGGTSDNFDKFFEIFDTKLLQNELSVLVKVFRHGIAHSYLPKLGMEISYHSKNPPGKLFLKKGADDLILNVNYLVDVVKTALDKAINDQVLCTQMQNQYQILIDKYEKDCKADINLLAKSL